MFEGTFPAVATPFCGGRVDLPALRRLAAHLVGSGVDGLVACGTTGEAPTLTQDEWTAVVTVCVEVCGELPVIAGCGTNSTSATVLRTRLAGEVGATGALVVSPYYNKPSQRGLLRHFETVAGETGMPIVLYNVPSRTGGNMLPETVATLSRVDNIVGIKDAAGSTDQFADILRLAAPGFKVLSGDDSLSLPLYALGGHGVISTTAVAAPAQMAGIYNAWRAGKVQEARRLHYLLVPLFKTLFAEVNPCPLKYALSLLGFAENELRLPLVPVAPETEGSIRAALVAAGLLEGEES
jgi:4-hydroxy-tetrahydrodipicolinate synthase